MEVIYNVKYSFNIENKTAGEIRQIFNRKLLNIILILENKELILKSHENEL